MCVPRHQSLRSAVTLSPHECELQSSRVWCHLVSMLPPGGEWEHEDLDTRICQSFVSHSTWKNWPIHPHLWWCIEINYCLKIFAWSKNICSDGSVVASTPRCECCQTKDSTPASASSRSRGMKKYQAVIRLNNTSSARANTSSFSDMSTLNLTNLDESSVLGR